MNRRPSGRLLEVMIAVALTLAALAVLLVRLSSAADQTQAVAISVTQAWARPSFGRLATSAVYLRIDNRGAAADRLMAVRTDASETAQLHQTTTEGGIARMRHLKDGLAVAANGSVLFAPGGYHVMLTGLKQPLKKGQTFPLILQFEKAGEIEIEVTVAVTPPSPAEIPHGRH